MPYSSALTRLREAIAAEQHTVRQELQRYLGIYEKMAAHQRDGSAMTTEEHAEWAAAVNAVEKIRELQGRNDKPFGQRSTPNAPPGADSSKSRV